MLQMWIEEGIVIIIGDLVISQETVEIRKSLDKKRDWDIGTI